MTDTLAAWDDLDQGLFSISVAAQLAGLHPQTLRIYERAGLVDPGRTAGGTRRYSRNDVARLQEICVLADDGLNLAGIRRVLALQAETSRLQAEIDRLQDGCARPLGGWLGGATWRRRPGGRRRR
jgi:MerR family transcriptional regulator/heat shock protein HspR